MHWAFPLAIGDGRVRPGLSGRVYSQHHRSCQLTSRSSCASGKSLSPLRRRVGRWGHMPTGKVKSFNTELGYGYIEPDESAGAIFVQARAVERSRLMLEKGIRVEYEIGTDSVSGKSKGALLQSKRGQCGRKWTCTGCLSTVFMSR